MAETPANHAESTAQAPLSKEGSSQQQQQQQQQQKGDKSPPGGFDATPVPHAPPGYTVRITFHRATALPIADLSTLASDPYLIAELKTSLSPRHKEDPPLRFRSHTVWRSTQPEWNEDWILHHVPSSGFRMKIRIYDEDSSDTDDRLGNVHVHVGALNENWSAISDRAYNIKKRSGSKRAYLMRAFAVCFGRAKHMSGEMHVSVEVLGRSPGTEGGRTYTVGRQYWCKHYSPLLGRITGSKEPDNEQEATRDARTGASSQEKPVQADPSEVRRIGEKAAAHEPGPSELQRETHDGAVEKAMKYEQQHKQRKKATRNNKTQRYNFQANQFQLQGPVPAELYHRYVEFRPFIKSLFTKSGLRGQILARALHHQHNTVYNFNQSTRYGVYDGPCREMTLKFLDNCHWDQGGRIFTYVLTLDALLRFTETGKEFGIDLLSKHTMHSDACIYIAFSGEFFIRRLKRPYHAENADSLQDERPTAETRPDQSHPPAVFEGGPPKEDPPQDPAYYELVIDNDSGTYRPNAKMLPVLRKFLMRNFPGLKVATLDCQKDEELMNKLKTQQRERKKKEQGRNRVVYTQASSRSGSISSSDEERLDAVARGQEADDQGSGGDVVQTHKFGEAITPLVGNHPHVRHALGEKAADAPS